ncbi:SoxR reducing system RseC family protein [Aliidiomarina halalkaliphila]|uniref:SoxR reducing system RseC family protein n=1 Tax=Aliidiomarina halalkaliphila TaxID=2593535 RepID=A0A552X3J3_9GAMM|nr:SoxR reducing system RseC family protein [Aliidiomarina halalkaliphila]TRW49597.1 SoxR reducing system RseC family protein [Aliidiomarina halalkaliphila]
MIRELGEVIEVDGNSVTIATQLKQGCGGCQQQNHCGAGLLSKAFPSRQGTLSIWMDSTPAVGDTVELLLPEQVMVRFSFLLYLVPLLALFAGAWLGQALLGSEGISILLGFSAFALSFIGLKRWLKMRDIRVRQLLQVNILAADSSAHASSNHSRSDG